MDTVQEENSPPNTPLSQHKEFQHLYQQQQQQSIPQINIVNEDVMCVAQHSEEMESCSLPSSRRPSAILAALRRPSQAFALSAAHAFINQHRHFFDHSDRSIAGREHHDYKESASRKFNRKLGDDALTVILSALYAKLLVVLGMAFPITEIISKDVRPFFYQGYYLYLYLGSIVFVAYMYLTFMRERAAPSLINPTYQTGSQSDYLDNNKRPPPPPPPSPPTPSTAPPPPNNKPIKYGSFYLRLGAIAFGIGSMVYSGLEFGRYFELKNNIGCYSNVLQAITPATRMLLTLMQMQFIFLSTKHVDVNRHRIIARFGLMHMIATNLCEWLYVLVEETKHEITHLGEHIQGGGGGVGGASNETLHHFCVEGQVMGSLITNASPFLFPCTIEYSLICAVILFEMWKNVMHATNKNIRATTPGTRKSSDLVNNNHGKSSATTTTTTTTTTAIHYSFNQFGGNPVNSSHHFSVDCSNAHRGLFAGIMVIVLTIISLIMFFVLANKPDNDDDDNVDDNNGGLDKSTFKRMAELEVNIVELLLYIITTIAVIVAMVQMRSLKYDRKIGAEGHEGIGLDNTLLVVAQTGMFIYSVFSIIGFYFTPESNTLGVLAETFSFVQTCLQTMFVLDGWWRRCGNIEQVKNKPGREIITFLLIANMAMWTINTLEKNRAAFRPTHLEFFGNWAWTIITHISMPLAIFYRFHSTICLFEIWKTTYKIKSHLRSNSPFSYM